MMTTRQISGYTYGSHDMARSPVSLEDLERLEKAVMFDGEDRRYLRMAGDVLADRIDDVLDVWYGFIASQPHLVHYFKEPTGRVNTDYLLAVRERFGRWIMDTCRRPFDQQWLDYQNEIAARHYRTKKNQTDRVQAPPIVHLRYMVAMLYPVVATIKPFLAKEGHSNEDVERMYQAWFKAVTLQVALWSEPYVKDGDY